MRLIDADALKEAVRKEKSDLYERFDINSIVNMQQEVDAVQVVRCKDCKYWWNRHHLCSHPKMLLANTVMLKCGKEFYCAYGERKDNEQVSTDSAGNESAKSVGGRV